MEDERAMSVSMGGEVAERLEKLHGNEYECWCGHTIPLTKGSGGYIMGYPHHDGTPDDDSETWWMYVYCPECEKDTTLGKVESQIQR